jgi:hypothetical protein
MGVRIWALARKNISIRYELGLRRVGPGRMAFATGPSFGRFSYRRLSYRRFSFRGFSSGWFSVGC